MLDTLGPWELTFFLTAVMTICYFVGTFVDQILDREAFDVVGNMIILGCGSVFGIHVSAEFAVPQDDYILLLMWGICGAFGTLAVLIITKMVTSRFGF
ncbi:MAG: hypothetical protein AAGI92_07310 [Pseudomonadota bacterium]